MRIPKKTAVSAATFAALALALSACGGGSGGGGGSPSGGETSGAAAAFDRPITWMSMLHTPTTPTADGPIHEALVEHTGAEFEIQWVPDASKEEKLNAALASNTLSDITSLTLIDSTTVRNARQRPRLQDQRN